MVKIDKVTPMAVSGGGWTMTIHGTDERGAFEVMHSVATPDSTGLLSRAMEAQQDLDRRIRSYRRLCAAYEAQLLAEAGK